MRRRLKIKKRLQRRRLLTLRTNPEQLLGAREFGGNNFKQMSETPADLF
ncbi:MAG TPA: hypothetical protein VEW46_09705 [Pyrinomonadaceae bacterium]|nr:hypothetical protein [Pyrinomonadaceae bacterium]